MTSTVFFTVLTYKVDVFTGDVAEADTNAVVYAMLIGERGDTGHRKLLKSLTANSREDLFQLGKVNLSTAISVHIDICETIFKLTFEITL
jgi:hypothetical protein